MLKRLKIILSIKKQFFYSALQALCIFLFCVVFFGSCSPIKDVISLIEEDPISGGALSVCIALNSKIDITGVEKCPALARENKFVADALYDTLVSLNRDTSLPIPSLVEKWKISEDKKEYLFYLKEGIYFHDGTKLRAIDAVRSISSLLEDIKVAVISSDEKNQRKVIPSNVEKIEIVDSLKFKITLKKGDPFFLFSLSAPNTIISSGSGAGTGAFSVSLVEGDTIYADRFDAVKVEEGAGEAITNHSSQENILLDRIVFRFVPDKNIAFLALSAGDADIVSVSGFDTSVPEKIKNNSKFKIVNSFGGEILYLFFSPLSAFFEKRDYRVTAAYSIPNFFFTNNTFSGSFFSNSSLSSLLAAQAGTFDPTDFIPAESGEEDITLGYNYIDGDLFAVEDGKDGTAVTQFVLKKLATSGFSVKEKNKETISADLYIAGGFSPYINPEYVASAIFPEAFPEGLGFFEIDKKASDLVYDAIEELLQNQLSGIDSETSYEYAKQIFKNLYPWLLLTCSADTYVMDQNVINFAFSEGKINIAAIWKKN